MPIFNVLVEGLEVLSTTSRWVCVDADDEALAYAGARAAAKECRKLAYHNESMLRFGPAVEMVTESVEYHPYRKNHNMVDVVVERHNNDDVEVTVL